MVYSGGSTTDPSGTAQPYSWSADGYGGGTPGGTNSGQITATFTWQGGKAPPAQVVVREFGVAVSSAGASPFPSPAGNASNGLGDPAITTNTTWPIGSGLFLYDQTKVSGLDAGGSRIPHYRVIDQPGTSFSITCSPTSSAPTSPPGTATVR